MAVSNLFAALTLCESLNLPITDCANGVDKLANAFNV